MHSRQATINVGTIGHVAHGKSTVVKALSGVMVSPYTPTPKTKTLGLNPNPERLLFFWSGSTCCALSFPHHPCARTHSLLQTVRFKNELERNITIKLGYANAKIYKR